MKIKNGYIVELANVLFELKLTGTDSRMRSRFRKLLATHQSDVVDAERKQLIEDYANRDENGEMIYIDENRVSVKDEFYVEFHNLLNEEFIIENSEANKEMLVKISEIMLNTDYEFSGDLADLYDIWCVEFENVLAFYSQENE